MGLTRYQQETVEQICRVFENHQAYIVADEVGLGKTYVSIGLIKKMGYKRIIYIASNREIAAQNVGTLIGKLDEAYELVPGDRLSQMAANQYEPSKAYVMSLSPATTFTGIGSPFGNQPERDYYRANRVRLPPDGQNILDAVLTAAEKLRGRSAPNAEAAFCRLREYLGLPAGAGDQAVGETAFGQVRAWFNTLALAAYQPDLIIMDEFHRFHSLLDAERTDMQFNLWRDYIEKVTAQAERPKLLLLSATPYQYNADILNPDEPAEKEPEEGDAAERSETPFADFSRLRGYMEAINRVNIETYRELHPGRTELDYIYDCILCRTERNWLTGEKDAAELRFQSAKDRELVQYLRWKVGWQQACLGLCTDGVPCGGKGKIDGIIRYNNQNVGAVMAEVLHQRGAIQDYANMRTFLDETPEYPQFSFQYRTVYKRDGGQGTYVELREALSRALTSQGGYRIRKDEQGNVDAEAFRRTYGHYKWDALRAVALPENAEYLLWVPPLLAEGGAGDAFPVPKDYSKVLVFARYRMSTRAIAALSSMEAEMRLDEVIGGADRVRVKEIEQALNDELYSKEFGALLAPFLAWKQEKEGLEALGNAVRTFFRAAYSRKVLTAWSLRFNVRDRIIYRYCKAAGWDEMWAEYIECIKGYDIHAGFGGGRKEICSVLGWTDRERTRLVIMPDWKEETFPCSFGERYISDYSDRGANTEERHNRTWERDCPKNVTTRRLEYLRQRFQSPFYPFVMAASEVAQEGVDLHNYCANIIHWSAPSSLSAYIQEEGRVNRRCSYSMRRKLVELYRAARQGEGCPVCRTFCEMYDKAETIATVLLPESGDEIRTQNEIGLFPKWYLPNVPGIPECGIRTESFFLPLSGEEAFYQKMQRARKAYSTFGAEEKDLGEKTKQLCPYLRARAEKETVSPPRPRAAR